MEKFDAFVVSPLYPGRTLQVGSSGSEVARMQKYLTALRVKYPTLPVLTVDGKFGNTTKQAVVSYQALNLLKPDGVIGQITWNAIVGDYNATIGGSADTYPGIALRSGRTGEDVRHMQAYLNELALIQLTQHEKRRHLRSPTPRRCPFPISLLHGLYSFLH